MATDSMNAGEGSLFVIFDEPVSAKRPTRTGQVIVEIEGKDVLKISPDKMESSKPRDVATGL